MPQDGLACRPRGPHLQYLGVLPPGRAAVENIDNETRDLHARRQDFQQRVFVGLDLHT